MRICSPPRKNARRVVSKKTHCSLLDDAESGRACIQSSSDPKKHPSRSEIRSSEPLTEFMKILSGRTKMLSEKSGSNCSRSPTRRVRSIVNRVMDRQKGHKEERITFENSSSLQNSPCLSAAESDINIEGSESFIFRAGNLHEGVDLIAPSSCGSNYLSPSCSPRARRFGMLVTIEKEEICSFNSNINFDSEPVELHHPSSLNQTQSMDEIHCDLSNSYNERENTTHTVPAIGAVKRAANEISLSSAQSGGQEGLRVVFIGVFSTGLGTTLAAYSPPGTQGVKYAVKELISRPDTLLQPLKRYKGFCAQGLACHFLLDCKDHVFACVTAENYHYGAVASLLEELQVAFLAHQVNRRLRRFSSQDFCFQRQLATPLVSLWEMYDKIEKEAESNTRLAVRLASAQANADQPQMINYAGGISTESARTLLAMNQCESDIAQEQLNRATSISFILSPIIGKHIITGCVGALITLVALYLSGFLVFSA